MPHAATATFPQFRRTPFRPTSRSAPP